MKPQIKDELLDELLKDYSMLISNAIEAGGHTPAGTGQPM